MPSRIRKRIALTALVLASLSFAAIARPPEVEVRVGVRPPPMRVEHVPSPRAGYMWANGYWGWRGGAHVWIGGHWEPERPGYRFIDARWLFVDGAWAFYPGYWEPYAPVVVQAAPIVVQQAAPVYVEKPQSAAPDGMDPNFWYYCQNPAGYFPYVHDCGVALQQVTPTPQ